MVTQVDQELATRCSVYSLLARCLAMRSTWDAELVEGLASESQAAPGGLAPALRAVAGEMRAALAAGPEELQAIDVDHARLFLGPFEIAAAPYESLYLDPEHRLMSVVSQAVEAAYREAGLAVGGDVRDAPDHICTELEFMHYLLFKQLHEQEPCWGARASRFWEQHLGRWLPSLAAAIGGAGAHPYYDKVAALAQELVRIEGDVAPTCGRGRLSAVKPHSG